MILLRNFLVLWLRLTPSIEITVNVIEINNPYLFLFNVMFHTSFNVIKIRLNVITICGRLGSC